MSMWCYRLGPELLPLRPLRQKIMDVKSALDKCSFGALKGTTPEVLPLDRTNDGQRVTARLAQAIVVTLQTIGGGQYGEPKVSSSSVRFESNSFPAMQNAGGATQIYRFIAAEEGGRNWKSLIAVQIHLSS